MSQSHKGSRLIIQDAVYAVPFDSAHFSFNEDANGIQYGNMVKPNASSVYTMRPFEGKFGGSIGLDDATTNLASTGSTITNYASGNVTQTVESVGMYEGWNKVTIVTVNTTNSLLCYTTGFNVPSDSIPYTWSIDFICPKGNIKPNLNGAVGGGDFINSNSYRWTNTFTNSSGAPRSADFYFSDKGGVVAGDIFYWRKKQAEQKPYATSFVVGSRNVCSLAYSDLNMNPSEGTISLWIFVNDALKNISNYRHIFSVRTLEGLDDGLALFHDLSTAQFRLKTLNSGGSSNINIADALVANGWRHITARWSATRLSFFVDGKEVGSVVSPNLATAFENALWIGNERSTLPANTIFSELRIDRYAASDEEILSWYVANEPFYNPYDYRGYAY